MTDNALTSTVRESAEQDQTPFEKICVEHEIDHLETRPRRRADMGNIEHICHRMEDEILSNTRLFTDLDSAQRAMDSWVASYNSDRATKN